MGKSIKENVIKQPRMYYISMISVIAFCFIGLGLFPLFPNTDGMNYLQTFALLSIVLLPLLVLAIFLLLFSVNWEIEIKEKEFIYTNMFKKKKIYNYANIEIKIFKSCIRIYNGKKHIVGVSFLQKNYQALVFALRNYKKVASN
jgi:hypothetical protein